MAACGSANPAGTQATSGGASDDSIIPGTAASTPGVAAADPTEVPDTNTVESTVPEKNGTNADQRNPDEILLQSASVDLNGDGENEQVEAIQISTAVAGTGMPDKLEGKLRIRNGDSGKQVTFWEKEESLTGMLTSMQFEDLDGDGAKDVFIIIPGNGASFSFSNFFIYSYKKDIYYSFTNDISLTDFIGDFHFKYSSDNKLSIINSRYNFTADLAIEFEDGQLPSNEYMLDYESRAWIDPVSIDISEASRLALTTGTDNLPEIKVPLPVFGLATVDMIGEIDLFYTVDSSFNPVLKRFEVYDFKGSDRLKAGSCEI
ncbi:MAG: hypothetical protein ABFD25_02040 [Clostridiaceae bacterium]